MLRLADRRVRLLSPITERMGVLKKVVNQCGSTICLASETRAACAACAACAGLSEDKGCEDAVCEDADASDLIRKRDRDESTGAGPRKAELVRYSMYACVKLAVLLIRGARRRAVRAVGERVRVRPRRDGVAMSVCGFLVVCFSS